MADTLKDLQIAELRGRIGAALQRARRNGQSGEAHHLQWVIDQMVRDLTGDDEGYLKFISDYECEDGDPTAYEWDTGIAP